jgi:competence protein ComEA
MKPYLKDYLTFSKRERRGAFVLMAIIILLLFAPLALEFYQVNFSFKTDYSAHDAEIDAFLLRKKELNDSLSALRNTKLTVQNAPQYTIFNPNEASAEDWLRLGVKPKVIKTILNYTSKGGKFYKKEDVKKMYGMDDATYQALVPFMRFKSRDAQEKPDYFKKDYHKEQKLPKLIIIELNAADSFDLVKIKGIGESFASRIVKYRNRLGGFISKSQLLEVYNLTPEKLLEIDAQIIIDPKLIKKININKCSKEELARHPYLNRNIANSIVRYREQHGFYSHSSEIQHSDLVNEELYRKLAPYLTIEPVNNDY